ncbi:DUF2868 domain-containing protein [Desulfobacula sp.]|uniref:DUF2868 domain-containing protein n=1 Tax=Desulfobacula sp. TaxID=2593537 RepID=UPI00260F4219|nr:DUF2868 domain-containing protein [Desulfobacula sp.]
MKIKLKDIIDLDYFIRMDEALDTREAIRSRAIKDRKIYDQCKQTCQTDTAFLFTWLTFRKAEFFQRKDKKGETLLPGTVFSSLYTWMVYAMVFTGGMTGVSLAYSFLAYHGNRPINVAVFMAIFVALQVVLILLTLILLMRRRVSSKHQGNRFGHSIVHTLVSALLFKVLPGILKKVNHPLFKKTVEPLEYTASLIRIKHREYKDLFFWPVVILSSVFSFCFSTGAVCGTFFRVIVSDMAFGWQSTLMTTSDRVHDLVAFLALPWSWFLPQTLAHPSLAQIEGSRIILKDGISVLATQDLISWWPFLCLGILFYAVIPRGLLLIAGILGQHQAARQFNIERSRFRQVLVRMQSPVLDIDTRETPVSQAIESNPIKGMTTAPPAAVTQTDPSGSTAVVLASKKVYSDAAIQKVVLYVQDHLCLTVNARIAINFDFDEDTDAVSQISSSDADQVILLHEVWQPPIRGVLYYIQQIKSVMPENKPLWILLTQDAGQEDLCVSDTDINFEVWKKAVFKLENPDIGVKRFL